MMRHTIEKKCTSYMSKHNRRWRHCSKSLPLPTRADPNFKLPLAATNNPPLTFLREWFILIARCSPRLDLFLSGAQQWSEKILVISSAVQQKYLELPSCVGARSIALVTKVTSNLTPNFGACRNDKKSCWQTNKLFTICRNIQVNTKVAKSYRLRRLRKSHLRWNGDASNYDQIQN